MVCSHCGRGDRSVSHDLANAITDLATARYRTRAHHIRLAAAAIVDDKASQQLVLEALEDLTHAIKTTEVP